MRISGFAFILGIGLSYFASEINVLLFFTIIWIIQFLLGILIPLSTWLLFNNIKKLI